LFTIFYCETCVQCVQRSDLRHTAALLLCCYWTKVFSYKASKLTVLKKYAKMQHIFLTGDAPGGYCPTLDILESSRIADVYPLESRGNYSATSDNEVGTLAVDGWAVTFGTARRGLGGLGALFVKLL